jgi:hypothetical protein
VQFGNQKEGFNIDSRKGSVVVTAHGFWSAELAAQLVSAVLPQVRAQGPSSSLVFELAELRPLRDEGQIAFKDLITSSLKSGVHEVVVRTPSALTKLQMLRIAREIGETEKLRVE